MHEMSRLSPKEKRYRELAEELVVHPSFPDDRAEEVGELMADAFMPEVRYDPHKGWWKSRQEYADRRIVARRDLCHLFRVYLDEELEP